MVILALSLGRDKDGHGAVVETSASPFLFSRNGVARFANDAVKGHHLALVQTLN